jgi:hypothetical protein
MRTDVIGNGATISYWETDAWVEIPDCIEMQPPSLQLKEIDNTNLTSTNKISKPGIPTITDATAKFDNSSFDALHALVGSPAIFGILVDEGGASEYLWVFNAYINIVEDARPLDARDTITVSFAVCDEVTHTDPA